MRLPFQKDKDAVTDAEPPARAARPADARIPTARPARDRDDDMGSPLFSVAPSFPASTPDPADKGNSAVSAPSYAPGAPIPSPSASVSSYASPTRAASASAPAPPDATRWRALCVLILFTLGTFSILLTQRSVGYAWDEAYYYEPAKSAAQWLDGVLSGTISPLDADAINRYWDERHEHPSVQKLLSGVSLRVFEASAGPIAAMRGPMAPLFGGTLCLIFLLAARAWGIGEGLVSVAAYAAMPRVFGDSHLATMEPPLIFMTLLTVYCFVRGLDSRRWAVATGVALGVLVATKINGFFLIPPLLLWGYVYRRRDLINNVFFMMFLGPVVFVTLWPWLWPNAPMRILEYLQFHAGHQQTAVFFEGRKWGYGGPNAPWYYPSVMTGATVPIGALALALFGVLITVIGALWYPLPVLFLTVGVGTWALASAPGTPKYDGVRLFLPMFPFLALMAGAGAHLPLSMARVWDDWRASVRRRGEARAEAREQARANAGSPRPRFSLKRLLGRPSIQDADAVTSTAPPSPPRPAPRRMVPLVMLPLLALVFIEGAVGIASYAPFWLSYFNVAVGGIQGAERKGFEVAYWGDTLNPAFLNDLNSKSLVPHGASIKPLALHEKVLEQYQRWGLLRRDLRLGGDPPFDYHLLQWRRGFFGLAETALADSGRFPALRTWSLRGVPLLSLHRTDLSFYQYLASKKRERDAAAALAAPTAKPAAPKAAPSEPAAADPPKPAAADAPTTPALESAR